MECVDPTLLVDADLPSKDGHVSSETSLARGSNVRAAESRPSRGLWSVINFWGKIFKSNLH